jgi:ABC-type phosphate transport system permease subunit
MRYFRSLVFDVGLMLALIGVLAAFWTAKDIIALTLPFFSRQWSSEGSGGGAANMNVTAFVLAFLLAMIGLAILVVGTIRVRRGT